MGEILRFEYEAATEGILIRFDALTAAGGPIAGHSLQERLTLVELDAIDSSLAKKFRTLLVGLEAAVRKKIPTAATPKALEERAAALAHQEELIARSRAHAAAELKVAQITLSELDTAIANKKAELDALSGEDVKF